MPELFQKAGRHSVYESRAKAKRAHARELIKYSLSYLITYTKQMFVNANSFLLRPI